jgi:DNA-binding MarR family transcriptional regulator
MVSPEEILKRLFEVTVLMSDAMEEDLARRGLTRARATLLAYLRDRGPTIQSALARGLRVSPRNITGLVNGLQASGLVKRLPHPTDGRAALVELTDDGVRAAAALARDEREFAQYLFADRTTGDLTSLAVGLDQLLARLNDPAYATLRRSALRRWPLTTSPAGPPNSAGTHGATPAH